MQAAETRNLTPEEAANWLGVSPTTLRDWRSDEVGPNYIKVSYRCVRYALEDLIRWRDERRHIPSVRAAVEEIHVGS